MRGIYCVIKTRKMKTYLINLSILCCLLLTTISCAAEVENKKEAESHKEPIKQTIKVALLLDTSNSMDGLINQAKAQLWDVVNELSYAKCKGVAPNLKIALYEYGNDSLESSDGYIKQVSEFTNDLDEISEHLFGLTTNGGQEYCGQVIDKAVKKLAWGSNKDDLKMVFIAGNESFSQGDVNFSDAILNAKEEDITVNTIFCGSVSQGEKAGWKEGATIGGGDYMTINHNKKMVHVITPYDDAIIILNKRMNKTYIHYGSKGSSRYKKQTKQDANASSLNEEVAVKRAVTKSSKLYDNSGWDLVDASKKKAIQYSSINKNNLPIELQGKSSKELEAYVVSKRKERKEIQDEIQELNAKRKKYVTEKNRDLSTKDGLENALINAIKKQAEKKNYSW